MPASAPRSSRPLDFKIGIAFFAAAAGFQIGFVICIYIFQFFTSGGDPQSVLESLFTPGALAFQVVITCGALSAFSIIPLRMRGLKLGITYRFFRPANAHFILGVFGILPLGFFADELTFVLQDLAPSIFDPAGLDQMADVFAQATVPGFVLSAAVVTVGPAIGEELLFRGLLLRSFLKNMPPPAAIVASSILFGVIHFNMLQGTGAALIGAYLGYVTWKTDSIWPAILAHGVNNLVSSLYARFDPQGSGSAFTGGHEPMVLVLAGVVLLGVIAGLVYFPRKGEGYSS